MLYLCSAFQNNTKMKNYLPLLLAVLFCACHNSMSDYQNKPVVPDVVDFSYTIGTDKRHVTFTNKSSEKYRDYSFKWEFGDGSYLTGYDSQHYYTKNGRYKVILKAYNSNNILEGQSTQYLTINSPDPSLFSHGYIKGCKIYKIPYNNAYYQITCTLTDWDDNAQNYNINPVLLYTSSLPYTIHCTNPIQLSETYPFCFGLYQSVQLRMTYSYLQNGTYTQVLKQSMSGEAMDNAGDLEEYIFTSNNGEAQVGLLIEYEK